MRSLAKTAKMLVRLLLVRQRIRPRPNPKANAKGLSSSTQAMLHGDYDMIVLDEITYPLNWGWLDSADVLSCLHKLAADSTVDVVLLDCLSGWVSNLLLEHENQGEATVHAAIAREVDALCDALPQLPYELLIVSNEVGCGTVPPYPLGRWYHDALGLANQRLAESADVVCLVAMGIPQLLKGRLD